MSMAMAYDQARKVVFAFGGRTNASQAIFSRETWVWDGQSWSLATMNGPALASSWAAFDETSQQVVVFGEQAGMGQTWTWNGSQWHQMSGPSPDARSFASMGLYPRSRQVILFGGLGDQTMTLLNDTWTWTGTAWTKLGPTHSPSPRQGAALASFSSRQQMLMVGGLGRGVILSDAWEWDGVDWLPAAAFGPRADAAAVDVGTGVLVFGGEDTNSLRNDSGLWDGATWAGQ
jgi:hypothetical protein